MNEDLLSRLVNFRQELHQYPEISMKQFQTRERIRKILLQFGVKSNSIKDLQPTALVVDLQGQAPPQGKDYCVAFRADMDALSMNEDSTLEYKSKNDGAAHMCGHDGHMTCLVGFVPIFLQKIPEIPSNKTVRLLFQPSQEGPQSGAKLMIEQNCLEGVDEVYGFHNWPGAPIGQLWCQEGPVMSQITVLKIKIIGTGGHSSEPEQLKVAIWKAVDFYHQIKAFLEDVKKQKPKSFVCTLPVFQTGERFNVIADTVVIQGSIRSFELGLNQLIIKKIEQLLEKIREEGFNTDLYTHVAPATVNTKAESDHVLRVARSHFGEQNVGKGPLPFRASEDFGYYTKHRPGAFFFLSTLVKEKEPFLHNNRFNFNDNLIERASTFWMKLALDRLGSQ